MKAYKENNLLVVDGSALLNILFYGSISDVNKAVRANDAGIDALNKIIDGYFRKGHGHYTENVGKFIQTVLSLSKDLHCASTVVVFDKDSKSTFRKKKCPEYKANRTPKPDAIKDQALVLHCVLNKIGIKCYWCDLYEADDLAGSLITGFKDSFDTVYFYTKDHDWFQLLGDNVKGIVPQKDGREAAKQRETYFEDAEENNPFGDGPKAKGKNLCITSSVCFKMEGYYPEQVVDFKALAGDKSDNIKGVGDVGEVTAKRLLELFGSLDDLYQVLGSVDEDTFKSSIKSVLKRVPYAALVNGRQDADLAKFLATIKTDIPMNFGPEELRMEFNMQNIAMAIKLYNLEDDLENCF